MEATGVYHLPLATHLTKRGVSVLVANPGRSHAFAESQGQLNKNDPLDARSLQRYGASRLLRSLVHTGQTALRRRPLSVASAGKVLSTCA